MKINTILIAVLIFAFTFTLASITSYGDKSDAAKDQVILGTDGDDRIVLNEGNKLVNARDGNDKSKDGPGDNYIIGGDGNDTVMLSSGDDYVKLGPGDDTLVINLKEDIGNINLADGGEGNDTVIFVTDEVTDILNNEYVQYFEKEKVYGKKIVDMGGLNVAAGLSNFEQVGVAASFTF